MDGLVSILRAAGESTRLRLLAILSRGELTVTELTQVLGQSQPRISRHLKLLVDAGLLERKPEGSWAFYRLAQNGPAGSGREAARLAGLLVGLVPDDDPSLMRDLDRLEGVKAARSAGAEQYFRINAQHWSQLRSLHVSEDKVEHAILELVGPGPYNHLLDLGTGTGRMLELLAQRIRHGTGIDSNREMLALARTVLDRPALQHCEVRQGDIFALPFPAGSAVQGDGAIDVILIHQVLHYLTQPAAAIAEAARVLAPGGRLLVIDFAPHDIEELRDKHAHRRLGFAQGEVAGFLEAAGLEVDIIRHLAPDRRSDPGEQRLTVTLWRAHAL
jgi:ubiquinone/menaquinone biosynthesis C-methylase UbiE/DNA-binding transcriptional ArsR family regulator